MKKSILWTGIAFVILGLFIMTASAACTDCCWFTGGGQIHSDSLEKGSFGGNAMTMKDGDIRGEWEFVDHEGNIFHGQVETIECYMKGDVPPDMPHADVNTIWFTGTGVYNHIPDVPFTVEATDRGEPGVDDYFKIWINRKPAYPNLGIFSYEGFLQGNLQIHPSNNGHPCFSDD